MIISVQDADGAAIGSVTVESQYFESADGRKVNTLIVGDDTLDLAQSNSFNQFSGGLSYGATSGDDSIVGGTDTDTIAGFEGNDTIIASQGAESWAVGDAGDDVLTAAGANQIIHGEQGNDTLHSGDFSFGKLNGAAGDDVYIIEWQGEPPINGYLTDLSDSAGADVLDLAAELSDLRFESTDYGLRIRCRRRPDGDCQDNHLPAGSTLD